MKEDSPSETAYLIARSTCFLSRDPVLRRLIPERAIELSKQFINSRRRLSRLLDALTSSRYLRPLARALERATVPGIKLHYILRKRYLEEVARAALVGETRQVVVLGAGFDTLALRLHESFPAAEFFEVDHPATQGAKRHAVETDHPPKSNLHFVALDLTRRSLEEGLLAHPSYRPGAKTLFIAEGLLMYLAPADVDLVLEFVRRHGGGKSSLAFTFMETQEGGRIGFRESSFLVDRWLRLRGESFKWGLDRARAREFLAARGFVVKDIVTSETLREKYLAPAGLEHQRLAEGECVCVASADVRQDKAAGASHLS